MKKQLWISAVLINIFGISSVMAGGPEVLPIEPNYFNGFFIGGVGALHETVFSGSSSATSPVDVTVTATPAIGGTLTFTIFQAGTIITAPTDSHSFDGYGGVQGGVGKVFNHHWYLGVMGFGEWGTQSETNTTVSNNTAFVTINAPGTVVSAPFSGTNQLSTTAKISNDYGVAAKLGFLVAPRTMIYGKIGASWADISVSSSFYGSDNVVDIVGGINLFSISNTAVGATSSEENKTGLLLGAGFEQFIYKDLISVNVEYDYTNYGTVSAPPANLVLTTTASAMNVPMMPPTTTTTPATVQSSASAIVTTFLAGLNVYFGGNWF